MKEVLFLMQSDDVQLRLLALKWRIMLFMYLCLAAKHLDALRLSVKVFSR